MQGLFRSPPLPLSASPTPLAYCVDLMQAHLICFLLIEPLPSSLKLPGNESQTAYAPKRQA